MKRKVLAGFVVFGLSILIAGTGSVFAGENETPVYGESQYGVSFDGGFIPHSQPSRHGVTIQNQRLDRNQAEWADHHEGDSGKSAEYWQAVGTGSLPGPEQESRLVNTGVDPARWAEPQAE